jgi:phosphoesterase RecJ-like protein
MTLFTSGIISSKDAAVSAMDWTPLKELIDRHSSFLITSHVRPDADALGSELGLRAILLALGKSVVVVNGSAAPANLEFMNPPGAISKLNGDITKATLPPVDVILIVDTSSWQQLGSMADVVRNSGAVRVVIDHHVSSDQMEALEFRDVTAAATGELIFELAQFFGVGFDSTTANWVYAAIATDTGWFRFPSTTPRTLRITASLMDAGAVPHSVYSLVHEQVSMSRLRMGGRILGRATAEAEGRLVWVQVEARDLAETGAVAADTEGLVNQCLTIAGSEAAFIAVELPTGQIKFSLRCRQPHNVAALAEQFAGGGHHLASGCTLPGPIKVAVDKVRAAFLTMLGPGLQTDVVSG